MAGSGPAMTREERAWPAIIHEGRADLARHVVRPRCQGLAGKLDLRAAAVCPCRYWLRRIVQRRGRSTGTVRVASCAALRHRAGADDRYRAGGYSLHRATVLAKLSGGAGTAGRGDALRTHGEGRTALARARRPSTAAVRT